MDELNKVTPSLEEWKAKITDDLKAELEKKLRRELQWEIEGRLNNDAIKRKEFMKMIIGQPLKDAENIAKAYGFSINVKWEDGKWNDDGEGPYCKNDINVFVLHGEIQPGKCRQVFQFPSGDIEEIREPWWG